MGEMSRGGVRLFGVHEKGPKGDWENSFPFLPQERFFREDFHRRKLESGGRKEQELLSRFLINRKTGMTLGNLQVDSTPMNNDPTRHVQQMKPQRLQPSRPPRTRQTLSFHHCQDIVSQNIQTKPSGIGKEPFTRHTAHGQIILQNIDDFLHSPTPLPLPTQKSLPIPTPHIGNDGKVMIPIPIGKQISLSRPKADGQIAVRLHALLDRRLRGHKLHLGPFFSPDDPTLFVHFPQGLPGLLGKFLNDRPQLLGHIRANGKLDSGLPRNLLPTPIQQLMDIGRRIRPDRKSVV